MPVYQPNNELTTLRHRLEEAHEEITYLKDLLYPKQFPRYEGLHLTRTEGLIVHTILRSQGPVSDARLKMVVYGDKERGEGNISVFICYLRPKLQAVGIELNGVYTAGYYFKPEMKRKFAELEISPERPIVVPRVNSKGYSYGR